MQDLRNVSARVLPERPATRSWTVCAPVSFTPLASSVPPQCRFGGAGVGWEGELDERISTTGGLQNSGSSASLHLTELVPGDLGPSVA